MSLADFNRGQLLKIYSLYLPFYHLQIKSFYCTKFRWISYHHKVKMFWYKATMNKNICSNRISKFEKKSIEPVRKANALAITYLKDGCCCCCI